MKSWLSHPLTRGIDLDDPRTTHLRLRIIQSKPFLQRIYREWYAHIVDSLPAGKGAVLEIGSGAGFLSEYVPDLVASDLFNTPGLDIVLNGLQLPFADGSLRAIVIINVLHHLPDARRFFRDAQRCLRPGGAIILIEPWISSWSKLVYRHFHHEPIDMDSPDWEFPSTGPLSGANSALPWNIFKRDLGNFEREFPVLKIEEIEPFMPIRYLLSGGVSLRALMPGWSFTFWRGIERVAQPWMNNLAMFAYIRLTRQD